MKYGHTNALFAAVFLIAVSMLAKPAAAEETLAHKLAVINEARQLDVDDLAVTRTASALKAAVKVCPGMTEMDLANKAVKISEILRTDGVYSRPVDVLEGIQAILFEGGNAELCMTAMAQYAAIRKSPMTHSGTVAAMRVLYKMGDTRKGG